MQVDPLSGQWLDVAQVAKKLGICEATFKKRLRNLEVYRVSTFGDGVPGRVSHHLRSQARFTGRAGVDRFEAELDRSFPKWREFPGKEKLGRRFFWEMAKIELYLLRVAGIMPLP